jgi:cysteine desulfurase
MRSGTLNVPGIVGLAKACEIAQRDMPTETARLKSLRDDLIKKITNRIQSVKLNGHPTQRLVNNANFSFSYVEGESLILACRDVALSSGSACTSESLQSSYVLREIGVPDSLAHCSIRFGLGRVNTKSDIELVVRLLEKNVQKLRELSPLYDMAKEGIDIDNFSWSKHSH